MRVYHLYCYVCQANTAAAHKLHSPVKCSRAVRQKAQVAGVHVPRGRQASSLPERVGVACESFS